MNQVQTLTVAESEAGQRLDRWFRRRYPELGHGRLEKLLRTGQVRVDGHRAKSSTRLESGQSIRVPPLEPRSAPPESRPLRVPTAEEASDLQQRVLYRDDWLIALDKPAGLAVQGGTGQNRHLDAMLDALRFGAEEAPRLVHRLDKDTSGVLLLARTAAAARALTALFKGKDVRKLYWAAVAGVPRPARGKIDLPLSKQPGRRGEQVAGDPADGKPALTLYQTAARCGGDAAWLVLLPVTGRTHQLRSHCAALGHPILGDGKFGGKAAFLPARACHGPWPARLQLHAREIALPHPSDGTTFRITAPLPPHMADLWVRLGFDENAGERTGSALEDWAIQSPFKA